MPRLSQPTTNVLIKNFVIKIVKFYFLPVADAATEILFLGRCWCKITLAFRTASCEWNRVRKESIDQGQSHVTGNSSRQLNPCDSSASQAACESFDIPSLGSCCSELRAHTFRKACAPFPSSCTVEPRLCSPRRGIRPLTIRKG